MGIKGLSNLIIENSPESIREEQLKNFFSRVIAIDANMAMYQFLIGIRSSGMDLANEDGEVTNHLQGLLSRTVKFVNQGIKPVYVFDGKPPEMKSGELLKRREAAAKAKSELEKAQEEGDAERITMFSKRTVRVSKEQTDDAKKLLKLMGMPVVESPTEAESQCAELVKEGLAYGVATEDMDALTFGTKLLVRYMSYSDARKKPIQLYDLEKVLEGLGVTMDEFIDICILCGCDYCDSIRGIGPKKALSLIKQHKNIEGVIKSIKDKKSYVVPDEFPYEKARSLFKEPDVTKAKDIKLQWKEPDEEGLLKFMVEEKQFDETRIKKAIEQLKNGRKKPKQERITSFFTKKAPVASSSGGSKKRKRDIKDTNKKNTKKKKL